MRRVDYIIKAILSVFLSLCIVLFSFSVVADSSKTEYSEYIQKYSNEIYNNYECSISVEKEITAGNFEVIAEVQKSGLYLLGLNYRTDSKNLGNIEVSLKVDGLTPFEEAENLYFSRMWKIPEEKRTDGIGNEYAAELLPLEDFQISYAINDSDQNAEPIMIYLESGVHNLEMNLISEIPIEIKEIVLKSPTEAENYKKPTNNFYSGEDVIIEGEKAIKTNSFWLIPKSDGMSSNVTPNNFTKALLNYIGGDNWKKSGETIVWKTPHMKAGYYQLGFVYRQNLSIGSSVYRNLKIDGETPFSEAEHVSFNYSSDWNENVFSNKSGAPYLIYLSEGEHEISLSVSLGEFADICEELSNTVFEIGNLYIDMTVITGNTVDIYRDYDLFGQIPDMEQRLNEIKKQLTSIKKKIINITESESGTYTSSIGNVIRVIDNMLSDKYSAQRYVSNYYSYYCALAETLNSMYEMPLDIDKIILSEPESQNDNLSGFWKQLFFSIGKFVCSFTTDYNNISTSAADDEQLTVWINWGRDQAQVLNSLLQTSFSKENNISVNVKVVNASVVQAVLSGNGPDCFLSHARSEPINLAMRGVLYNLEEFSDIDDVLARFQPGAELPYRYKDGLYALPDSQNYYVMFYRKDVLDKLGISVPKTWDEFEKAYKVLAKNNLEAYIPYVQITNVNQVNSGIGSLSIFPSLLLQNSLELYTKDGKSTTLSHTDTMDVFTDWTYMYNYLKLPVTVSFYNRFRTGVCPIGIDIYTTYNTIKAAASEIEGLWGVAPIPGTLKEDGTIDHTSSGGGTACIMLKNTKNPDAAWKLLKWWTSAEVQTSFSNNIESVLGPTGRSAVSNIEAWKNLSWDRNDKDALFDAWNSTKEIPEVPGSYYVSRAIDHSFWNVVNNNKNPKDMLLEWSKEVDQEILRKWNQYENR